MAVTTGTARGTLVLTQTPTGILAGTPLQINSGRLEANFVNGVVADAIDLIHAKTYTFAASTPQDLDLKALTDVLGATVNFARVRLLAIKVKSTTDAASLTLSPGSTNGWTALIGTGSSLRVMPSTANTDSTEKGIGFFLVVAPNTTGYVTGASNKVLTLTPSAHAFDADVFIAGTSS